MTEILQACLPSSPATSARRAASVLTSRAASSAAGGGGGAASTRPVSPNPASKEEGGSTASEEDMAAAKLAAFTSRSRNRSSLIKSAPDVLDTIVDVAADPSRSWLTRKEAAKAMLNLADGEDTVKALFKWPRAVESLMALATTALLPEEPDAQEARKAAWETLARFTVLPDLAGQLGRHSEVLDACATEILAKPPVATFSALTVVRAVCECSDAGAAAVVSNIRLVRALVAVVDVPLDDAIRNAGDPSANLQEQMRGQPAEHVQRRPKSMSMSIQDDDQVEISPEEAVAVAHLRTQAFCALFHIAKHQEARLVLLRAAPNIAKIAMQCLRLYDGSAYRAQVVHFLGALEIQATVPTPRHYRFAPFTETGRQIMYGGV